MPIFVTLLMALAMIGIGIFRTAAPDIVWEIEHFYRVKGGEPTGLYRIGTRISGVVMIVLGVCVLVECVLELL